VQEKTSEELERLGWWWQTASRSLYDRQGDAYRKDWAVICKRGWSVWTGNDKKEVPTNDQWCSAAGKITVRLASHLPRTTYRRTQSPMTGMLCI